MVFRFRFRGMPMQVKNVPEITPRYWTAILVASMCGANTGDFLSHNLHLGHTRGLLPLAALFLIILGAERRARTATEAYYWLAIIVLRTAATNLADLGTHDLKLGYGAIESGLTVLLIFFLLIDRGRGSADVSNASIANRQRPNLPATNTTYWLAMLTAGTLGTASGDFVADVLSLGLGLGSVVLVAIFAAVLLVSWQFGAMSKPWYWASIVAARTAGTTLGDLLASRHGLDLGLPLSTAITASMLAAVVVFWPHRNTAEPIPVR
jgi:uncharacterized membrane-anchored protein